MLRLQRPLGGHGVTGSSGKAEVVTSAIRAPGGTRQGDWVARLWRSKAEGQSAYCVLWRKKAARWPTWCEHVAYPLCLVSMRNKAAE